MAEPEINVNDTGTKPEGQDGDNRESAEITRLKAALDKATKEAGDYRKQLRDKQTAEEAAAAEAKERQEATERELNELRKTVSLEKISKRVIGFVGDEAAANTIAEAMYGADNSDTVISACEKAWTAKEKALRLEFGKIPKPGVGSGDGPMVTREQLNAMSYTQRNEFATQHPDEYNKLMGR